MDSFRRNAERGDIADVFAERGRDDGAGGSGLCEGFATHDLEGGVEAEFCEGGSSERTTAVLVPPMSMPARRRDAMRGLGPDRKRKVPRLTLFQEIDTVSRTVACPFRACQGDAEAG